MDLFFLLNVWMNLISCRLLAVVLKKKRKLLRSAALSAGASAFACVFVICPVGTVGMRMMAGQIVLTPLLVFLLFGDRGAEYGRELSGWYLVMFALSGAVSFLRPRMSFMGVLAAGTFAAAGAEILCRILMCRRREYLYETVVIHSGRRIVLKALFDSGNSLCEPISGEQVHIVGKSTAERIGLPDNPKGVRVIPFHTIGNENGILMGYYADSLEIFRESGKISVEHPLIGVSEKNISADNEYEMILNSGIFD